MKLKPADIDRILEDNIPRSPGAVSRTADDYAADSARERDELVESLIAYNNTSSARKGEALPLAPKSLDTQVSEANDFGITPTLISERTVVQLPPALRGGDLDKIQTRADLLSLLTSNLPLNELGLPKIIYRADLLDWRLFCGSSPADQDCTERYKTMQDFLDMATIWLNYSEGFPALPTGEPLWAKLPFEDAEHYAAFTDYCTMPGARRLAALPATHVQDQVQQWFHEDYWSVRAKCYDMLNAIHSAKVREQRILACEDDHYLQAEHMMKALKQRIHEINWEILVDDPKQFVEVMERVAKLQRLALGLSSMAGDKRELKSESMEITMRKIAQPNLIEDKSVDGGIDVRQLLKNPEALASAQELIIRMTKTNRIEHHKEDAE